MFMGATTFSSRRRTIDAEPGGRHPFPLNGRFLQPDPVGYEAGLNLYGYVKADPINFVDPSGLQLSCNSGPNCYDGGGLVTYRPPAPSGPGFSSGGTPAIGTGGNNDPGDSLEKFCSTRPNSSACAGEEFQEVVVTAPRLPPCQFSTPKPVISLDLGLFLGFGGGLTLGVSFDGDTGAIAPFASARAGYGWA